MSDDFTHVPAPQSGRYPAIGDLQRPAWDQPMGFGRFLALPASRTLLSEGVPVDIGGRAFDLLIVLLRSRGALVTRNEIVSYVWPTTTVDESNLRFQMACLRRTLGEARDYIKTVPGRGYLFVGSDEEAIGAAVPVRPSASTASASRGKGPSIVVIDRDDVLRTALARLLRSFDVEVTCFRSFEALLENAPAVLDAAAAAGIDQRHRLAG